MLSMTASTNLALINLTPYTWHLIGTPQSYQMPAWDSSFPSSVLSGHYASVPVSASTNPLKNSADDSGNAQYTVAGTPKSTVELQFRAPNSNFVIETKLEGISTLNNSQGSLVDLGFEANGGWVPYILAGTSDSFYGNNPPKDWMQASLDYIGCASLQNLSLPGSHDSGMSTLGHHTNAASSSNTVTQSLGILDQLRAGVRYFDIRPVLFNRQYYTGHYSYGGSVAGWQGGNGQSISDVINDINTFTAHNDELIILYLSNTHNIGNAYNAFSDNEWLNLLHILSQSLHHRYLNNSMAPLTTLPLSDFISKGPAVVTIVSEREQQFFTTNKLSGQGFFPNSSFPIFNSYSDTSDLNTMRKDQYSKFLSQAKRPALKHQLFLLSWTVTEDLMQDLNPTESLIQYADAFNAFMFEVGTPPLSGPLQWTKKGLVPNVILIDDVKADRNLAALALAMNRWYVDCSK